MRRRLSMAILAAGAVIWPMGAARAVDHEYYAVAVGDEQAVLVDRATRARTGDIVALDVIVLQKQPSNVAGQPTYWVDGIEEIDCAGHRTRIMLIAALPLDRSRKFNSANAAFRPWTSNAPGSDIRAVEDFVCNDGSSPGIRLVADLTAFQRRFFNGEAGLAARGERAIADARAALQAERQGAAPPPAARQAPPPPAAIITSPGGATYYAISRDEERVQLINRDQIVRGQGFATAPSIILLRTPIRTGGREDYWVDSTVQFDCDANRVRTRVQATYNLDRTSRSSAQASEFAEWTPVERGSAGADVEALVCDTRLPANARPVTDLDAFRRDYFALTAPPGAPRLAQGPGQIQPAPVAGGRYVLTSYDKQTAELFDRASARRTGDIVSVQATVLGVKPRTFDGDDFYWVERTYEFDCAQHRSRDALTSLLSLDRKGRIGMPRVEYSAWGRNAPGSIDADTEAMLCRGAVPSGMTAVADLAAFQRTYFAYARSGASKLALGPASAGPALDAPGRATASSGKLKPWYVIDTTADSASVLLTTDALRKGDVVTTVNLMLLTKPMKAGGQDAYWIDGMIQVDCAKHLVRSMATGARPLDRSKRTSFPNPSYDAWAKIQKTDPYAEAEVVLCEKRAPEGVIPVDDLTAFQKQFFAFAQN